jgi:hypothetical protein
MFKVQDFLMPFGDYNGVLPVPNVVPVFEATYPDLLSIVVCHTKDRKMQEAILSIVAASAASEEDPMLLRAQQLATEIGLKTLRAPKTDTQLVNEQTQNCLYQFLESMNEGSPLPQAYEQSGLACC